MRTYEKIETIYARDMEGTKKLIPGTFRNQTIEFLKDNCWEWTEKVDGTNVRIFWDGHAVTFGGRTDKAQMPMPLVNKLNEYFGGETNAQIFEQAFGEREVILFDVLIHDNYQPRESVEGIAEMFGVKAVPVVGYGTLEQAVEFVKIHPQSTMGNVEMEGVVCRPSVELRDRAGNRVIVKIKWHDFKDFVGAE